MISPNEWHVLFIAAWDELARDAQVRCFATDGGFAVLAVSRAVADHALAWDLNGGVSP